LNITRFWFHNHIVISTEKSRSTERKTACPELDVALNKPKPWAQSKG